ncbi:MAG: creatininase family protein [Planctomycetota bacterium]
MAGDTHHWTMMTPSDLDEAIARMPLALVPAGSLEWHGEHLATGCDTLRGEAICAGVADRLGGGVVLPALWVTAPGFCNWRGSLFFTPRLVKQVAAELYAELDKCGFRHVLVLLAHAGAMQSESFEEPADAYVQQSDMQILVRAGAQLREDVDLGGGHAQANEAAELLAACPEAVFLDRYDPAHTRIPKYGRCEPEHYCSGLSEELHEPVHAFMAREHFRWQQDLAEKVTPEAARRLFDHVCDRLATELSEAMTASGGSDG